ncbi:MAG: response regulator [Anaerolineales bacterium]|nr:response regulator [Anaerolineales bacterium]
MTGQIPLLHIEPDAQTAEFIRHTLQQAGYSVTSVQNGKEGLIVAWRDQPQIVVSELDLPDIDGFELIEKLRNDPRTRKIAIVGLTKLKEPSSAARASEAGVDRYFVKQPGAVDLLVDFLAQDKFAHDDHSASPSSSAPGHQITALVGIKGGVGTSSLALNIAHHIGLALGEGRVLAIDFDLPVGSLSFISGAHGKLTLDQLLVQEPQALAGMTLHEELLVPKAWSCAVLPGFIRPERLDDWISSNIPALLQSLRNQYEHLVVDLGRDLSPPGHAVLAQSDHILLLLQPDQECVARAKSIFNYLVKTGIDRSRIHFITNRPHPSESLTARSTEEALGHPVLGAIPYMGDRMNLVITLHAPLALRFPETPGNVLTQEVAGFLVGEGIAEHKQESMKVR